uniref:Myb/SANT-like DNA-binding domain-containing protein n=1 Tax=Timema tahoe TaxID=61484 RepID=A0A7R9FMC9_9NEOP|nr:unnamed protein product [Timema tahoe]
MFFFMTRYLNQFTQETLTWNYSESGHGKGAPDGVGATLKRTADQLVAEGKDLDCYETLIEQLKERSNIKIFTALWQAVVEARSVCLIQVGLRSIRSVGAMLRTAKCGQNCMDSMDLYNGISNGKPSMPHSATTRATAKTKKVYDVVSENVEVAARQLQVHGTSRSADVTHKKCQPGGVKVGRGSVKPGLLYGVLATWCASLTLSALALFLQTRILTIEIALLTNIPLPMLLPLGDGVKRLPHIIPVTQEDTYVLVLNPPGEVDHTTEGSLEPDFDSNNSDELESDVDGEEHSTPIWSDSASRLLISLYSSHIELVGSENVRTMKQMWQQVAEAMRQEGYNYTNFQVENRWKTFRRSFKRKLKSGTTLGGRTVRCPFERELEPLLGDQQRKTETNNETPSGQDQQGPLPEYSDILWVSSEEQSVEDEEEAEEPAPPTDPKYIAKGPFKRKRQCISQVLNQMKETMATNERNKHKRHKEKMALLREKNEILQMNNAFTLCSGIEDGHEAGEYSLTSTLCSGIEDGHEAGEYSLTSTLCSGIEDGHEAGLLLCPIQTNLSIDLTRHRLKSSQNEIQYSTDLQGWMMSVPMRRGSLNDHHFQIHINCEKLREQYLFPVTWATRGMMTTSILDHVIPLVTPSYCSYIILFWDLDGIKNHGVAFMAFLVVMGNKALH